jgi:dsRNA-specific ribonuclease
MLNTWSNFLWDLSGDSVLGFFLALNAMARNSSLEWNADDLGDVMSTSGRNAVLAPAAFRVGLCRLVNNWPNPMRGTYFERIDVLDLLCISRQLNSGLPDSVMADVFESVLAAIYLWGRQCSGCGSTASQFIVDILNQARLPFPRNDLHPIWFATSSACIADGFAFDATWKAQLATIANDKVFMKRNERVALLVDLLKPCPAERQQLLQPISEALLASALFNEVDDQAWSVSRVRDTLFHVGAFGLQLYLSEVVFNKFANAKPGDLHLLRAVALTDDMIAYTTVKFGLHGALTKEPLYHRMFAECSNIGGGRVLNQNEKLPAEYSRELMVSFKCIFGALVAILGLDRSWSLMGHMFDELLLLSAAELRQKFGNSTLVASYQ